MVEKKQIYATRQSDVQHPDISDKATENDYDEFFNLFIEFAMLLYMEDKLGHLLARKNIEKKWNDKLTRSFNRF